MSTEPQNPTGLTADDVARLRAAVADVAATLQAIVPPLLESLGKTMESFPTVAESFTKPPNKGPH